MKLKFKFLALMVSLACVGSIASAAQSEDETLNECDLKGSIHLNADTTILCRGDLRAQAHTKIVTNGFALQVIATGNLLLPQSLNGGLTITATEAESQGDIVPAPIYVFAHTASGFLAINNKGSDPEQGAPVTLEYTTLFEYDQKVEVPAFTQVDLFKDGERYLADGSNAQFGPLVRSNP